MVSTAEWAASLGISIDPNPPAVEYDILIPRRTARQIGIRALCLHGVVSVGYHVEAEMFVEWFQEQNIWQFVTPHEKAWLLAETRDEQMCSGFRWKEEAQAALLWMVGKVDSLGLPDHQIDAARLVDEIMPPIDDDIEPFLASCIRRPRRLLAAEDDRTYDLWVDLHAMRREKRPFPENVDLIWTVLEERRYAFEWLYGPEPWDKTTADA